jgi:hypothetical protein
MGANYRVDCFVSRGADWPVLREGKAAEMPDLAGGLIVIIP